MTQEELIREFLSDELFEEKYGIDKAAAAQWSFNQNTDNKLIIAIRTAISKKKNDDSEETIARNLNQLLNK
jgi:hypothetical protein